MLVCYHSGLLFLVHVSSQKFSFQSFLDGKVSINTYRSSQEIFNIHAGFDLTGRNS